MINTKNAEQNLNMSDNGTADYQDVKIILNKAREHLRNSQTNEKIMNALLNAYSLKFKK